MRGNVRVEVVRNKIVITMLFNRRSECGEVGCVAKHVVFDRFEHLRQLRVELEVSVEVPVAELLDVFGKCAEEEDVLLADFAGDFNLWM